MTKRQALPEGKKILTRFDMVVMFGVTLSKIEAFCKIPSLNFPAPIVRLANNQYGYDENDILTWLETNDPKAIDVRPFWSEIVRKRNSYQAAIRGDKKKETRSGPRLDLKMSNAFLSYRYGCLPSEKAKKASGNAKTKRTTLDEKNDYVAPNSYLSKASNHSEHRLLMPSI